MIAKRMALLLTGCAVIAGLLAMVAPALAITPTITEFSAGLNAGADTNFGMAAGPDGNVWFTDRGSQGAIGRITPAGAINEFSTGLNGGSHPEGIAAGPDGNLWFTDAGTTKAIGRVTPAGTINEFSTGLNSGSHPFGIAAGPDGNLWFTDTGTTKAIGRVTPTGTISESGAGLSPGSVPSEITAGADGNMWFGDQSSPPAVGRVTLPAGTVHEFTAGLSSGARPYGVTTGPDANVWFTDSCTPVEIGRITPAGAVTEFAGGGNPGSCPYFIAAGPDGNLWFSDEGTTPAVGRITPTGATTEFSAGLGASSLLYGIVAGPDGNVWFTDTGTTQAIGRITTPPVATTGGASVLGSGAARVDGTLNGHAQPTTDRFEFGPTAAYGATSSPVDAGAGFATEPATATLTGLTPNTTYHYRLDATNPTDTTPGADATFTTLALPLLGTVTVKPSRWRLGASLVQISRKRKRRAPVGTRISFSLDRAVPVQLQFSLRKPGRTVKKRCAAPTRRNRKARRCTRLLTAGVLAFPGHAGKNTIRFQGRISRSKRLRAGRYQLQVSATDLTSPTQSSSRGASFTIVRR